LNECWSGNIEGSIEAADIRILHPDASRRIQTHPSITDEQYLTEIFISYNSYSNAILYQELTGTVQKLHKSQELISIKNRDQAMETGTSHSHREERESHVAP
jgi:hypothetical protein